MLPSVTPLSACEKLFDAQLEEAFPGYVIHSCALNASAFGVPQIRRRAFIVAFRNDPGIREFSFPSGDYDSLDIGNDSHTEAKAGQRSVTVELVAAGIGGWKMHVRSLVGCPDFAFTRLRVLVFVDGCFWHGCPRCYRRPHSNHRYWDAKVARNHARDQLVRRQLRKQGWRIIRIWEHDLQNRQRVSRAYAVLQRFNRLSRKSER